MTFRWFKLTVQEKLFFLIPIFLLVNLFVRWNVTRTLSPDSYSYFQIADSLPYIINESIFPVFYPILLKLLNYFVDDYLITYKLISLFSLLFSLSFVFIKDFYWKEIWVMLTFHSFLRLTPWALSEIIFHY